MWNGGNAYDYYSQNHRPEGVLALSAGLIALGGVVIYRAVRSIWKVGT